MREAARALNINETCINKYFINNQQKPYKKKIYFHKSRLISSCQQACSGGEARPPPFIN